MFRRFVLVCALQPHPRTDTSLPLPSSSMQSSHGHPSPHNWCGVACARSYLQQPFPPSIEVSLHTANARHRRACAFYLRVSSLTAGYYVVLTARNAAGGRLLSPAPCLFCCRAHAHANVVAADAGGWEKPNQPLLQGVTAR